MRKLTRALWELKQQKDPKIGDGQGAIGVEGDAILGEESDIRVVEVKQGPQREGSTATETQTGPKGKKTGDNRLMGTEVETNQELPAVRRRGSHHRSSRE